MRRTGHDLPHDRLVGPEILDPRHAWKYHAKSQRLTEPLCSCSGGKRGLLSSHERHCPSECLPRRSGLPLPATQRARQPRDDRIVKPLSRGGILDAELVRCLAALDHFRVDDVGRSCLRTRPSPSHLFCMSAPAPCLGFDEEMFRLLVKTNHHRIRSVRSVNRKL
jgi:hypothetical protein